MDWKKSLVSTLLCLAIISAGARAGSAQELQPLEPEWLTQMYAEGWQKVQEGVLQRDTGGGEFETFSYGAEGLQWVVQRYEQQVASLKSRYDASPSEDLAELIDQLEGQILRLEGASDSAPSAESFNGEVLEACTTSYGGDASAGPQTGTQGVTASASAYFHDDCGYLGDTFTTAYAHAVAATGETTVTHSDPKNGGAWLDSSSSASANGSAGCESWAQGSVTVSALNINYQTPLKQNFNCDPSPCGEATCVPSQGMYVSHFSGPGCTGTESYYLPYDGYQYACRTWDGTGMCGTIRRTVTNISARINGGPCQDLWPSGNTLSDFVTVYRGNSATLSVTRAGAGSGTVTSSPAGINCGATCSTSFVPGTVVTLIATAASGSAFAGWSGGGCSGTGSCTVTLSASQSVSATFTTPCGEATCVPVQAMYISHFSGPGCTGTESYYLPYDGYRYSCRTWNGTGMCGTIRRTVKNYSARTNGGPCQDLWPTGNTLSDFVTIYR